MALADFAGVLAGAVVAQAPPPGEFPFPKNADILAELGNSAANWKVVIQRHLDDFVRLPFQAIPATPVAAVRLGAKVAWNTQAQIAKIVRNQNAVAFTPPPTNDLGNARVDRPDYKLHQLQSIPGHDIANGFQLAMAYFNPPNQVPASAFASVGAAMQAINNLAVFEGFCIRLASAINAADRAGVSLSETLALWRTEGDLLVPWSDARRVAGAPIYDVIGRISLGVKNTADVFFSMKRGLWGCTYDLLIGPVAPLPVGPDEIALDQEIAGLQAFIDWSLITAGLDFFWKSAQIDFNPKNVPGAVRAIGRFLNANHVARFGAAAEDRSQRVADCKLVLKDLVCVLPLSKKQRVVVAPKDPVKLISLMLGEALIFAELDTVGGKGPVVAPTPKLKYLAYHCQDHRHGAKPDQDKFTLMLVSAAVAAANGPAGALKTSLAPYLNDADFPKPRDLKEPDFTKEVVSGDTKGHVLGYQKLLAGGWLTPVNLELLADFMLVATTNEWTGWEKLRGNMARYLKLLRYYEKLLG